MLALVPKLRTYPVLLPDLPARDAVARALGRRRRLAPVTRMLLVALLLVLPAILYVHQAALAARTGYDILRLHQEIAALTAENARLVAGVTALRAPDRIERIARAELGMVLPRQQQLASLELAPVAVAAAAEPLTWTQRLRAWLVRAEAAAGESR